MRLWRCDVDQADVDRNDRLPTPNSGRPPCVRGLNAGIIEQREFPLRKWYFANPMWYYHVPAQVHRLQNDPGFYKLVDSELRDLCRMVLEAGLCTTPSCQGHFYLRERFEKIWRHLQDEQLLIQTSGLTVRDSEDSAKALFQDPDYALPWRSFEEFFGQANGHQSEGYMGIAVPSDRRGLIDTLQHDTFADGPARIDYDPQLSEILGQRLFGITVKADNIRARDAAWASVTAYMKSVLATENSFTPDRRID